MKKTELEGIKITLAGEQKEKSKVEARIRKAERGSEEYMTTQNTLHQTLVFSFS